MSGYGPLARGYDLFTRDIPYESWADYVERHFFRGKQLPRRVVDLACGTGSLSWCLAERGYEVIGVDISPDMLAQAMEKEPDEMPAGGKPFFLCQAMEKLTLHGKADACICMLDSVNHVTKPKKILTAFSRVHRILEPGGLFLFDMLTPLHFAQVDGELFLDDQEDIYCIWQGAYDKARRIFCYGVDLFSKEGELWRREEELVEEYVYTPEELEGFLQQAGFCRIRRHGNLKMRGPKAEEGRIFFSAYKKG